MATEFNYVVNVDTTRVMGAMSEVRSQIGMALGGGTGITGAGSDFSGGAASAFGRMMGGMGGGVKFGTFTNDAMAYMPHHGMVQAHTTLGQERAINQGGVEAAAQFKPPGVSAAEFAMGVQGNFIDRNITAQYEAGVAARSSFYAGVGGLAAGEAASRLAGVPIGRAVGGAIASRIGGAGAIKSGRMIGGLGGMLAAYSIADDVVGGAIRGHYAERQMTEGITRELGEIAGSGLGMSRTKRYDLGAAAMGAAKNLDMDVQEMGNILALGRQSGMLPGGGADPAKAKQQFTDFARAVEEGAQILHTSLAGATQVIKTATSKGMSAEEGVMRAAGAGGPEEWLRQQAQMSAFGSAGAAAGRGMGFTGAQGRGVFMGGLGGSGLSGEETKIMGGRLGVASFVGSTQMAMAKGPLGDMQLMAAMSGEGGGSMMDMAGQAMSAMSEGGDFLSNMGKFMVHKDEYRRGIGAKGIQTMARQQLSGLGDIVQDLMPGMSNNEAQRFAAQSMGLSPDQAKTLVGAGRRGGGAGGGGGSALAKARQMQAIQGTALSNMASGIESVESRMSGEGGFGGFDLNATMTGGMTGMMLGPKGAIVGAIGGFAVDMYQGASQLFGGPDSAREAAQAYDSEMAKARSKAGYADFSLGSAYAFQKVDLSGTRLDVTASSSPKLGPAMAATMDALGYDQVAAGAGAFHAGGGKYYSNKDAQSAMRESRAWSKPLSTKDQAQSGLMAHDALYTKEGRAALGGGKSIEDLSAGARGALARLETGSNEEISKELREKYSLGDDVVVRLEDAGEALRNTAGPLLEGAADASSDKTAGDKLRRLSRGKSAINNSFVRETLGALIGADVPRLDVLTNIGRAGAVSVDAAIEDEKASRVEYLSSQFSLSVDPSMMGTKKRKAWTKQHVEKLIESQAGERTYGPSEQVAVDPALTKELWERATARDEWKSDPNKAVKLAQLDMGEKGRGFRVPEIDSDEKVMRRGAYKEAQVATVMSKVSSFLGFSDHAEFLTKKADQLMKKVSVKDLEANMKGVEKLEAAKDKVNKPRRGAQKAVGWGQNEESMNLINKSLKRTHKMLSVLEKKMGGSTPAGGAETSEGN